MAKTIPTKDADFHQQQQKIIKQVVANMERWGLNVPWVRGVLLPLQDEWTEAWAEYLLPDTRLPSMTSRKKAARKALQAALMTAAGMVKAVPGITAEELEVAGIAPAVGRGNRRNGAPLEAPFVRVGTELIAWLRFRFGTNVAHYSGKPHGVRGAEVRWCLGGEKPLSISEMVNVAYATHSPVELEFDEADRGRKVWFCIRWVGTAGEVGPWSAVLFAIVP
jgi:hypothetical protein